MGPVFMCVEEHAIREQIRRVGLGQFDQESDVHVWVVAETLVRKVIVGVHRGDVTVM